jgi:creatinine amidohydrolase
MRVKLVLSTIAKAGTTGICVWLLLLMGLLSSGDLLAAPQGPDVTTKGYSIFDGTMVDMTYPEIEKAAQEKAIVLFPTGVIEEHGPHLPLGVDTYEAYIKAKLLKAELEKKGIRALIAPPFYWGINMATASFAGSFTMREETMINVLWDALASLKRWGLENVFFVNNHNDADHNSTLLTAIRKARIETGTRAYYVIDDGLAKRLGLTGKEAYVLLYRAAPPPPSKFVEVHAGGGETSIMWYYFPDLVRVDIWKTLKSTDKTVQDLNIWRRGWDDGRRVTPQGIFGDPTTASPEKGQGAYNEYVAAAATVIEAQLKGQYQPVELK